MRILVASDHYPPLIGGAQIQTRLLAVCLAQRGHDVAVATTWQKGTPDFEHEHGFPVYRLRQTISIVPDTFQRRVHHQPPYPDPVTTLALRRLIKRFRPDLVHSHGWFTHSCAAALLGSDVPLVVSARDYGYSCATRTMLYMGLAHCSGPGAGKCLRCSTEYYGAGKGWLASLAVFLGRGLLRRKIVGVHSVSNYVQEVVRRDFLRPSRNLLRPAGSATPYWRPRVVSEQVIHEMVDLSEAAHPTLSERLLRRLPSEPFILYVGALRREKGVYELLEAYQRLQAAPALVLIGTVGRGTPETYPDGVVVITNVPHAAIPSAWKRALYGVAPSLLPEPMGSVVCEGLSYGRPVIGTAHGGHPDVITDGVNGLLVPPGDVGALARAMQSLLDDPERRERLADAAGAAGRRFAATVAVQQFERLYSEALRARRPNRFAASLDYR
jgi:glycosyltransferase involved in cell wall biosynthesis